RYRPISRQDLSDLQVTVTIVHRLEPLDRVETLTPADGLVLRSGTRTGVVLPWEGKAPDVRLRWAYKKAGISPATPCTLYRLIAERFRSAGASESPLEKPARGPRLAMSVAAQERGEAQP